MECLGLCQAEDLNNERHIHKIISNALLKLEIPRNLVLDEDNSDANANANHNHNNSNAMLMTLFMSLDVLLMVKTKYGELSLCYYISVFILLLIFFLLYVIPCMYIL